jgi:hypothetical protein
VVGKVPNVHNMSLTAAIDVLFSLNFDVVFDFMYLRFRPSKAKPIGNVLMNSKTRRIVGSIESERNLLNH